MEIEESERRFPPAFYHALHQFNAGAYFACHETLEGIWLLEKDAVREVYQGVLHIAVGCYHLTARSNWVGAINQLSKGIRRLRRWPARMGGVHLHDLAEAAQRLRSHLHALGRERVREYDAGLLPQIQYTTDAADGSLAPPRSFDQLPKLRP